MTPLKEGEEDRGIPMHEMSEEQLSKVLDMKLNLNMEELLNSNLLLNNRFQLITMFLPEQLKEANGDMDKAFETCQIMADRLMHYHPQIQMLSRTIDKEHAKYAALRLERGDKLPKN